MADVWFFRKGNRIHTKLGTNITCRNVRIINGLTSLIAFAASSVETLNEPSSVELELQKQQNMYSKSKHKG